MWMKQPLFKSNLCSWEYSSNGRAQGPAFNPPVPSKIRVITAVLLVIGKHEKEPTCLSTGHRIK
jgi:hypothetical protein